MTWSTTPVVGSTTTRRSPCAWVLPTSSASTPMHSITLRTRVMRCGRRSAMGRSLDMIIPSSALRAVPAVCHIRRGAGGA